MMKLPILRPAPIVAATTPKEEAPPGRGISTSAIEELRDLL